MSALHGDEDLTAEPVISYSAYKHPLLDILISMKAPGSSSRCEPRRPRAAPHQASHSHAQEHLSDLSDSWRAHSSSALHLSEQRCSAHHYLV